MLYIRLLLTESRGISSFEHLCIVDDIICDSFREAARLRPLVEDNPKCETLFDETAPFRTANVLRLWFVDVLVEDHGDPVALWQYVSIALSEDLISRID